MGDALRVQLRLVVLSSVLSVCKLAAPPKNLMDGGFCCIVRTDDEVSVICEISKVPKDAISREDGWRALKVEGPLDFGLVGILAKVSTALAEKGVPLFAISTYDTDYILVKEEHLAIAVAALRESGCDVEL